jgi:hypothetical protein
MEAPEAQISRQDRRLSQHSAQIAGFKVVSAGRWLTTASVWSEDYVEPDPAENAERILEGLRDGALACDLFTFTQRLPDASRRFSYPMRWSNVAALPLLGYSEWWEKRLNQDTRRCVRVAAKRGLVVREAQFDDGFCEGIRGIYNETPIRQGRRFFHYGKDLDSVRRENSTYVERSTFLGAYLDTELVGFLKMVYVGGSASIMQIISKIGRYDLRPMNALMAKAVEMCNDRHLSYLIYRKYVYYKGLPDSLTEFKRRNGFVQFDLPRYYAPLTPKGRIAVSLGLHSGVGALVPAGLVRAARSLRSKWYDMTGRKAAVPKTRA